MTDNLAALVSHYRVARFEYQLPDEWRFGAQLRSGCASQPFQTQAVDSAHFYTARSDLAELFKGRKQRLMEQFYRQMRQRHGVLMDKRRPARRQSVEV